MQRFNLEYRDTFTNPLTGRSLSFEGRLLENEVTATQVDGDVYEFTLIEAGQPFVLRDAAGNVVLRDRGIIRHRILFDTLGDGSFGGFVLDDTIVGIGGPHPAFEQTDAEFCAIAVGLLSPG